MVASYQVQDTDEGNTLEVAATVTNENGVHKARPPARRPAVVADADPKFWGSAYDPALITGVHNFGGNLEDNAFTGVVAGMFSSTTNYDPVNDPTGPYAITLNVLPLDPFFLINLTGSQPIGTPPLPPTELNLPAKSRLILPSVSTPNGINAEGIGVYVTQDGSGNTVLDQIVGSGNGQGDYSPISFDAPTQIENAGTNTIYNLDTAFRQDNGTAPNTTLSTYSVAWDEYNATAQTYSLQFQIFNGPGSPISTSSGENSRRPCRCPGVSATPDANGVTQLSAWEFRNAAGVYGLYFAEHSGSNDVIQFDAYNTDGTLNTSKSFSSPIQPNLTAYAVGATNHITQDVIPGLNSFPGSSQQLSAFQASANNANDFLVGWNETVTNGTTFLGDQVEFVVVKPGSGGIFRFKTGPALTDVQNVRVVTYSQGINDFAVLAYGDGTATHLVDFEISSSGGTVTQIASITDPTTQPFSAVTSLGDGRVAVEYDDVVGPNLTTQYNYKIFDFRTSGLNINDSTPTASITSSISGTTLTVTNVSFGTLAVGQLISGSGIAPETVITALGTGTGGTGTYTVSTSQTVASETMTLTDGQGRDFAGTHFGSAAVTGSISGTTLTVTAVSAGSLWVGQTLAGPNIAANTTITRLGTGTGGTGTYTVSTSQTVASETIGLSGGDTVTGEANQSNLYYFVGQDGTIGSASVTGSISGTTLTVAAVSGGSIAVGQTLAGPSIAANTTITALGTGTGNIGTYTVSTSQSVVSETISLSGQTDTFNGGTNGWNVAIFPDSVANYGITALAGGGYLITNTGDPAHSGQVTVDANVQALAFAPIHDPQTNSDGSLEATGNTLAILQSTSANATIDTGATLDLLAPDSGAVTFASASTQSLAGMLTLGAQALSQLPSTINFAGPGDVIQLPDIAVASATISGSSLTVKEANNGKTLIFTVGGALAGNDFIISSDDQGGSFLTLEPIPYLWSELVYPSQPTAGDHHYGEFTQTNGSGLVAGLSGDTPSGYSDAGPDTITTSLLTSDPFLLPYQTSGQQIDTTTITDFPRNRQQLLLPSLTSTLTEGIGFILTEDPSGTATINKFTFEQGTTGLNTSFTIGTLAPVETGLIGADLQYSAGYSNGSNGSGGVNSTFTGTGASYSLAWAQLSGTTYTADFQIFNPDGTTSPDATNPSGTTPTPIELFSVSNVTSAATAPAWFFRNFGTDANGNIIYASAIAELNAGANSDPNAPANSDFIQFQSYTVTGSPDFERSVFPDYARSF